MREGVSGLRTTHGHSRVSKVSAGGLGIHNLRILYDLKTDHVEVDGEHGDVSTQPSGLSVHLRPGVYLPGVHAAAGSLLETYRRIRST